jgi:hypothetical protein
VARWRWSSSACSTSTAGASCAIGIVPVTDDAARLYETWMGVEARVSSSKAPHRPTARASAGVAQARADALTLTLRWLVPVLGEAR